MSLSAPRTVMVAKSGAETKPIMTPMMISIRQSYKAAALSSGAPRRRAVVVRAAPDKLSEKVAESIKEAEEACSDDPASGECVAAWDEVEELSAAASHARDRKKTTDALEEYCKDNPEVDECRTYED